MFAIVAPIFTVIFIGYLLGRKHQVNSHAEKIINTYVLYVALPALLFLAIARADIKEINQPGFILAILTGIVVAYVTGGLIAKAQGITLPANSIMSMSASYGTTGYMGVPILITVYGEQAALPAAIATIIHNIPVIIAVIITHDLNSASATTQLSSAWKSVLQAIKTTIINPLTLAVLSGLIFVIFDLPLPNYLIRLSSFLGAAAGPTALFALGLGLAKFDFFNHINLKALSLILPVVILKLAILPLITLLAALFIFNMQSDDIWLITAIVMAAQPIGAGVYVFANKYGSDEQIVSLAIVSSLLIALMTLPLILYLLPVQ